MSAARRYLLLSVLMLLPIRLLAVDLALLQFCIAKPPDGSKDLASWHSSYCPQVLADALRANQLSIEAAQQTAAGTAQTQAGVALTQQGTTLTQEQLALTAQLAAEKATIENFKALLPAGITPTKPDSVDVSALAHLAKYRQAVLLQTAATKVGIALQNQLGSGTLLVNKSQLEELTRNAVDPVVITTELATLEVATKTWLASCPPEVKKTSAQSKSIFTLDSVGGGGVLMSSPVTTAIPLAVESLVGSVGRIATMFQTSLVGASAADLTGEQDALLDASLIAGAGTSGSKLYVTIPPVRDGNPVLGALDSLRKSVLLMAQSMGKYADTTVCAKEGKTLLDAVGKRLETLNTATSTGPSPIASALRRAALNAAGPTGQVKIDQYLLLSVDHASGSVAAVKRGMLSADYVQSAAVVLSYRVQRVDGGIVTAGVEAGGLDRQLYDKRLVLRQ